jgi:ribosome biogenesis protein BRX1
VYNSQILEKDPLQPNGPPQTSLTEIGPRFVLTPIRIFEGAFGGATVYSNPGKTPFIYLWTTVYITLEFISPTAIRSAIRREKGGKYKYRKDTQAESTRRKEMRKLDEDDLAVSKVFA